VEKPVENDINNANIFKKAFFNTINIKNNKKERIFNSSLCIFLFFYEYKIKL